VRRCAACGTETRCGLYLDYKLVPACSRECKRLLRVGLDTIGDRYRREYEEAQRAYTERTAAAQTARDAAIESLIRGHR
jgi:hypothetical protein